MNIDGTWHITVKTPDGEVQNQLVAASDGPTFTGMLTGPGDETQPISGATINGNAVSWHASLTKPTPLHVAFTGTVDGDRMAGKVRAGTFPEAPFTAHRDLEL
jgi:hypothetical protein